MPSNDDQRQQVRDAVACPYCEADRGEPCVSVTGPREGQPRKACHEERWAAAGIRRPRRGRRRT